MFELLEPLGRWSLTGLWLPLTAWTLVAACALLADARLPLRRPRLRALLLTVVLAALPAGLLLRALPLPAPLPLLTSQPVAPTVRPAPATPLTPPGAHRADADDGAAPAALSSPVSLDRAAPAWPRALGALTLGALTLLAGLGALAGLSRVALSALRLARWSRRLRELPDPSCAAQAEAERLGAGRLRVRVVAGGAAPCTFGVWRPTVVLPAALGPAERRMALRHELAHVAHRDALGHVSCVLCAALAPWHPAARRLAARADLRREQAADAAALTGTPARGAYARLLVRFSLGQAPPPALAFANQHLSKRLAAMHTAVTVDRPGRALPACVLAAVLAVLALPLRAQDTPPTPTDLPPEMGDATIVGFVDGVPTLLPDRATALRQASAAAEYPEAAREAGVEGEVQLRMTVSETGNVVASSRHSGSFPGAGPASRDATEALFWAAYRDTGTLDFAPATIDGEPVQADVIVSVRYRLPNEVTIEAPRFARYVPESERVTTYRTRTRRIDRAIAPGEAAVRWMSYRPAGGGMIWPKGVRYVYPGEPDDYGEAGGTVSVSYRYAGGRYTDLEPSGTCRGERQAVEAAVRRHPFPDPHEGAFRGTAQVACPAGVDAFAAPRSAPARPDPDTTEADVFLIVEEQPQLLPDTETALARMQAALVYPTIARRAGVEGRVVVQFVVDEQGRIVDPFVVRGVGAGADEEALRLVRTLRFAPGRQRGETVKVQMTLPVVFELDELDRASDQDR